MDLTDKATPTCQPSRLQPVMLVQASHGPPFVWKVVVRNERLKRLGKQCGTAGLSRGLGHRSLNMVQVSQVLYYSCCRLVLINQKATMLNADFA